MELVLSYLYVGYSDRAVKLTIRLVWQVFFLYTILLGQFFETRSLPGTWNSLIRVYWLAREPQDISLALGLQTYVTLSRQGLGLRLRVSCLYAMHTCRLCRLPSPYPPPFSRLSRG